MRDLEDHSRRKLVAMDSKTINTLALRSPWATAWFSFLFPGFGHFLVDGTILSAILITMEFFVNTVSKLNLLIFYTLIGEFEKAKAVTDIHWVFIYITLFVFCIWDSYRRCVENNRQYLLAVKEYSRIEVMKITPTGMHKLDKRNPTVAAFWSFLYPGLGAVYLQKLPSVIFGFSWMFLVAHFSNLLDGIFYTLIGDFSKAKEVLKPQWFLYLPSIYAFKIYSSYVDALQINKIFDMEQYRFLKENYQSCKFPMPLK
ncbi:MAG: hypothetical protein FH758_12520 [Firmicutes bacterium]|nr:hypothetical protein [Bacillota bacterium]